MEILNGDILECSEDIIVHQTNCMGVMGSGLAKQIKENFPDVFKGYYHFCKTNKAEDILGSALICEDRKYIANVFGQCNYGTDKRYTDYNALKSALNEVRDFAKEKGLSVAIPYKLGCGLAGGDWNIVFEMITDIFADVPTNIYRKD
jgi:O-acetyl-ADP-ribose deacetylase (regulator of RNase III)